MERTIKKIIVYLLIFIGTIIMLANIPSNAADYSNEDMILWTDTDGTQGKAKLSDVLSSTSKKLGVTCFSNKFVFCCEMNQNFSLFTTYYIKYKYVIEEDGVTKYTRDRKCGMEN